MIQRITKLGENHFICSIQGCEIVYLFKFLRIKKTVLAKLAPIQVFTYLVHCLWIWSYTGSQTKISRGMVKGNMKGYTVTKPESKSESIANLT